MGKIAFLIIVLVGGISLWFYLLLGGDNTYERRVAPETVAPAEEARTEVSASASTTPASEAPAHTDVGMEFPTLDE